MAIEMSETLYSTLVCVVVPAFYEKYRSFWLVQVWIINALEPHSVINTPNHAWSTDEYELLNARLLFTQQQADNIEYTTVCLMVYMLFVVDKF
jgi:hypothetical protein